MKPFHVHQVAVTQVEFASIQWRPLELAEPLLIARPFTCVNISDENKTGPLKKANAIMHFDSTEAIAIKETREEVANLCEATAPLIPLCDRKEGDP